MRRLHHTPLCPFSRFVRLYLAEKQLDFKLIPERLVNQGALQLTISPTGKVPLLGDKPSSEQPEVLITSPLAIVLYVEETTPPRPLLGTDPVSRAHILGACTQLLLDLFYDITHPLLEQKIYRQLLRLGPPNPGILRAVSAKLHHHLSLIDTTLAHQGCMVAETFTAADLAASAQLSILDYMGMISWAKYPALATWYARIKSRPSFRPLLQEQIGGIVPPPHYALLDF